MSYSHTRLSTSRFTLSGFYTRSLSLLNSHCTPFASVLSGFSTNTVFSVSLSFPYQTRVPKRPWPGSRRSFPRNYPLERTKRTMSRLSRLCLRFGRYLRPFVHDTTFIYDDLFLINYFRLAITSINNFTNYSSMMDKSVRSP